MLVDHGLNVRYVFILYAQEGNAISQAPMQFVEICKCCPLMTAWDLRPCVSADISYALIDDKSRAGGKRNIQMLATKLVCKRRRYTWYLSSEWPFSRLDVSNEFSLQSNETSFRWYMD